jgi:hypothetical protein
LGNSGYAGARQVSPDDSDPLQSSFLIRCIGFGAIARIKAAPLFSDKPTFARFQAVSGEDHASGRLEQGKWPSPRA